MPRATPAERAHNRRVLPNFLNFMRFLHPGQAFAAKFDRSTAELGWDGSLLHCKSRGCVVPSFGPVAGESACFTGHFRRNIERVRLPSSGVVQISCGCLLDARTGGKVNGRSTESACSKTRLKSAAPPGRRMLYQTRQEFAGTIGLPLAQPKALPNSSKFCTEPLTRQRPGEWGSVSADWRADCSV